jgi:hypothetical protein
MVSRHSEVETHGLACVATTSSGSDIVGVESVT